MAEASENNPTPETPRCWSKWDHVALLACMVVAILLAIAPHLTMFANFGTLDYLADHDDVLYLTIARAPYHGEMTVRDPFARKSDAMPTLYPWAQFVPFTLPARWLGARPLLIALVWRVLGGVMLGGSVFVLFRRLLGLTRNPTAWALGLSLVCLSDAGFVDGRTLIADYGLFWHMAHGTTPMDKADALGQYRVVTPLLNLPFLLLMVASLVPTASRGRFWILVGVACLGLCFQLYFFYWTAAVPALVASVLMGVIPGLYSFRRAFPVGQDLSCRIDSIGRTSPTLRGEAAVNRWRHVKTTALVLAGGLALGLPQLYANGRTFSSPQYRPILERMGRGRVLDAHDPVRTRYLGNGWAWGKLVVGGLAILAFRLRGLGLVWWLTFSGFAMANSALVTGLEFENFHWVYVHAPMGEILILTIVALFLDRWNPSRAIRNRLLWFVPGVLLPISGAWRVHESLRAPDAFSLNECLGIMKAVKLDRALESLGPDRVIAGPDYLEVALLFTRCGFLWQEPHSYLSSFLDEESAHERHALNAWLLGSTLPGYRELNRKSPFLVVPSGDTSRWSPEAAARRREAIFESIEADHGARLLDRYRPDVFVGDDSWGTQTPTRGGPWRRIATCGHLAVWVRETSQP